MSDEFLGKEEKGYHYKCPKCGAIRKAKPVHNMWVGYSYYYPIHKPKKTLSKSKNPYYELKMKLGN